MKRAIALLMLCVVLVGTISPSPAWARGPWHGGHFGGCCHGWFWPGALIGGLAAGAVAAVTYPLWALAAAPSYPAPLAYAPPPAYVPPATYAVAPLVAYAQAPSYTAPAPQVQREVVYPHGRYVLYGDGISQPWQWVWVPAAPPAPPAAPPPPQQ